MATAVDLSRIAHISQSHIVVDTNVLLFVFSEKATTDSSRKRQYSNAIAAAYKGRKTLLVDFVIISEMINRILRIGFNEYTFSPASLNPDMEFKAFRNSDVSQDVRTSAQDSLAQVLKLCEVTNHQHTKSTLSELSELVGTGKADTNDFHIARMCIDSDYGLLTDDRDMGSFNDLQIISSNPRLLRH